MQKSTKSSKVWAFTKVSALGAFVTYWVYNCPWLQEKLLQAVAAVQELTTF